MIETIKVKLTQARGLIVEAEALIDLLEPCTPTTPTEDTTTNRTVFGNSITRGYGVALPWVSLRSSAKGWPFTNNSVDGSMVWDHAAGVYGITVAAGGRSIVALGTNDVRHWGVANLPIFQRAHRAMIAWLATSESRKIRGRNLLGAGWSNTYAYGVGKASNILGAELTFQFTGDALLVGSIAQVGNAGSFNVLVDGGVKATVSCGAGSAGNSLNGSSYGQQLEVITGCGAGTHTAKIVVTSNAPTAMAYFEWAATPAADATVEVYNTPLQTGVTASATAACNAVQLADVNLFKSLGMRVKHADVAAVITAADLFDGAHPSNQGQGKWATVEPL